MNKSHKTENKPLETTEKWKQVYHVGYEDSKCKAFHSENMKSAYIRWLLWFFEENIESKIYLSMKSIKFPTQI